jgi:hypothetical protein
VMAQVQSQAIYVGFVVDKVALWQVFLQVHWFFPCLYHYMNFPYSFINLSPTLYNLNNWQHRV